MAIRMHLYGNSLHPKVLNHFTNIYNRSLIQYAVVPGLFLDIVVRFVPSCYPDSASSTHLRGFDSHKDASIWPFTALEGESKLYFHIIYIRSVLAPSTVSGIDEDVTPLCCSYQ